MAKSTSIFSLVWLMVCAICLAAHAGPVYLADQKVWGKPNAGFALYLDQTPDGLGLFLKVDDGPEQSTLSRFPRWRMGHDYVVKAVLNKESSELYLDGELVASAECGFTPVGNSVEANYICVS